MPLLLLDQALKHSFTFRIGGLLRRLAIKSNRLLLCLDPYAQRLKLAKVCLYLAHYLGELGKLFHSYRGCAWLSLSRAPALGQFLSLKGKLIVMLPFFLRQPKEI